MSHSSSLILLLETKLNWFVTDLRLKIFSISQDTVGTVTLCFTKDVELGDALSTSTFLINRRYH